MINRTIDPISYNAGIEAAAKVLDDAAQDWNRIRDPGMANNARSYAKKIRSLQRPEPQPAPASIVTCCVTGAIPGDGGACGDCDPCIMGEASVPDAVKRLIAEKNSLIARIGELEGTLAEVAGVDNIAPAPADAGRLALADANGVLNAAKFVAHQDRETLARTLFLLHEHPNSGALVRFNCGWSGLKSWNKAPFYNAADNLISLRAGGWREDMQS